MSHCKYRQKHIKEQQISKIMWSVCSAIMRKIYTGTLNPIPYILYDDSTTHRQRARSGDRGQQSGRLFWCLPPPNGRSLAVGCKCGHPRAATAAGGAQGELLPRRALVPARAAVIG